MRLMLLAATMLIAPTAAPAQQSALAKPGSGDTDQTIIVTAIRLKDAEAALAKCLDEHCPPDQDIKASITLAEQQFIGGDYHAARRTLSAARDRNRRYANRFPLLVSQLMRANARVAINLGESRDYKLSTVEMVEALKAGLPGNDPRILTARIEEGDMWSRLGSFSGAEMAYREVIDRAKASGLTNVQGLAMLHLAALLGNVPAGQGNVSHEALRVIDAMVADPNPGLRPYAQAALVLKARLQFHDRDPDADATLASALSQFPATETPVLAYEKPIDETALWPSGRQPQFETESPNTVIPNQISTAPPSAVSPARAFDDQWVDISFYVAPNGSVTDAAVVRQSPKLATDDWVKQVISSINARRYLPLNRDPSDPGVLRIERYTLTALYGRSTDSRIRHHSAEGRIERVDLSAEPSKADSTPTS